MKTIGRIILFLLLFVFLSALDGLSQHFIGKHKDEIAIIMKQEYKTFKLNTEVVNKSYNYLKYEDLINEMTMLFFLTDKDECKLVRLMSDYSNINDIIGKYDSSYNKVGKDSWEYSEDGKDYSVKLEDGDWFFTVTIKEKE